MNFDQNISEDTNSLDLESDEETIELKSTPLRNRTYPFTSQLSDPYKPDTSLKQSPLSCTDSCGSSFDENLLLEKLKVLEEEIAKKTDYSRKRSNN